jgi:hypothetical protein
MTEEFLHYIWKFKLFNLNSKLVSGENLEVIDSGTHNFDSGPDFLNARIKIGDTVWAGNVEIHIRSSNWSEHGHQNDEAYNNVILHVAYVDDKPVKRKNGELIPTLELNGKFEEALYNRYQYFLNSRQWIPCEKFIHRAGRFIINNQLDRLLVERLEDKSTAILERLQFNGNNWEQTFYEFLARNFGFKVNAVPFEMTAKSLPLTYLGKHKNNLLQIEAMLFGQAGFLEEEDGDEYYVKLRKEYLFLKKKFGLIPIDRHLWRFMRMRPSNFPTIRLSQFANLIHQSSHLFSKLLETEKFPDLIPLFDVSVSTYWENHYSFGQESAKRSKNLGKTAVHLIMINTVVPFLFIYGRLKSEQKYIDRALIFLDQLPGETNAIIRKWEELGMSTRTAYSTQALLQLKNIYCNRKRCLQCSIGNELLKETIS